MAAHSGVQQVQSKEDGSPLAELLALNTVLTALLIVAGHFADGWKIHHETQPGLHISPPHSLTLTLSLSFLALSILNQKSAG